MAGARKIMDSRRLVFIAAAILFYSFNNLCLVDYNRRNIGIREATGHNDGLYVQRFLHHCGLTGNYEWCAAYTLAGHKECKYDYPLNPCRADSWFDIEHTVYRRGDSKSLIKEGQVAGYYVKSKGRIGHNGTIVAVNLEENYALVTEGNAKDVGNTLQPGDGVHLLRRSLNEITATSDWQKKNVTRFHIVQPKETLYRLSLMYKTTVAELVRINDLESDILSIGQRLRVK